MKDILVVAKLKEGLVSSMDINEMTVDQRIKMLQISLTVYSPKITSNSH